MSEDGQELSIVRFFKSELKMVCDALIYKVNHTAWTQSREEERRKHEDILVKLLSGDIVTKINGGKHE